MIEVLTLKDGEREGDKTTEDKGGGEVSRWHSTQGTGETSTRDPARPEARVGPYDPTGRLSRPGETVNR